MSYQNVEKCLLCDDTRLRKIIDLGSIPLPNMLIPAEEADRDLPKYPLGIQLCERCKMIQLTHIVSPDKMFSHYLYIPSTSKTMHTHFDGLASSVINTLSLGQGTKVLDIGSNDGTLLSKFSNKGMTILGVDPARNLVDQANKNGIPTIRGFFGKDLAEDILNLHGKIKVITATNVLAHAPLINDFLGGVERLLDNDGMFVAEFPYGLDMLEGYQFDTIYHEHVFYFTLQSIYNALIMSGLELQRVEKQKVHGGTLRVFASKKNSSKPNEEIQSMIEEEQSHIRERSVYFHFENNVERIGWKTFEFLAQNKLKGSRVIGYGAPAKATVFLNYAKVDSELLPYILDSIPLKHGKLIPGVKIPIVPEKELSKIAPDKCLIFPWNFSREIALKNKPFVEGGGKFFVAVPRLQEVRI